MLIVQEVTLCTCDEKLAAICVFSTVCLKRIAQKMHELHDIGIILLLHIQWTTFIIKNICQAFKQK